MNALFTNDSKNSYQTIKLKQCIGRLQRSAQQPCIVYDYRDQRIGFFEQMFKKRKLVYKKYFGVSL